MIRYQSGRFLSGLERFEIYNGYFSPNKKNKVRELYPMLSIVSGFISLNIVWMNNSLRAGAGLAVFVVIYLINPPKLIQDAKNDNLPLTSPIQNAHAASVMVVTPDGEVLSMLNDSLFVDLQDSSDLLVKKVDFSCSIGVKRDDYNPIESLQTDLRGAIFMSKDSKGIISVVLGSRKQQYTFPVVGMKQENGILFLCDRSILQLCRIVRVSLRFFL